MYRCWNVPLLLWFTAFSGIHTADCDDSQPIQGTPTADAIAAYYSKAVNDPNSATCGGGFPPNNPLTNVFNANEIFFNVTRDAPDGALNHCKEAFNNIIDQCVRQQNKWGGKWSLDDQHYSIENSIYPADGTVIPGQNDGPPSVPSSSISKPEIPQGGGGSGSTITIAGQDGTITIPPQTITETGDFRTSYVAGVTVNTVTTTSLSDSSGPTILPIWFCKGCVVAAAGILIIPALAPAAGGLIPPPPGFPALAIGPDGLPTPTGNPAPGEQPTGDPSDGKGDGSESTVEAPEPTGDCSYFAGRRKRDQIQVIKVIQVTHRLSKRAEREIDVLRPLQGAIAAIGKDGITSASELQLVVNAFPKAEANRFVTGLQGRVTKAINEVYKDGTNTYKIKMKPNDLFRIRWDYDPNKGVHVNAEFFGTDPGVGTTKLAFFPKNKPIVDPAGNKNNVLFQQVVNDYSNQLDYQTKPNTDARVFSALERTGETTSDTQRNALKSKAQQLAERWVNGGC